MLETTVAGSLPKPSWLAESEKLWPGWKLEGAALASGKIDAPIRADRYKAEVPTVTGPIRRKGSVH